MKLDELLQHHDLYGLPGYPWVNERQAVLMTIENFSEDEHGKFCEGFMMTPEGSSREMFRVGAFPNRPCHAFSNKQRIAWNKTDEPKFSSGQVLLWNVIDGLAVGCPGAPAWIIDEQTICIPYEKHQDHRLHFLELFAGGFGGWHMANSFLRKHHGIQSQTIGIEIELEKAVNWALTHEATMMTANAPMPACCFSRIPHDIMIQGDVESTNWWQNVADWGVDYMTISSPCPQWSHATAALGLERDQGWLLPATILLARTFRPKVLLLEQVSGFATHRHKKACLDVVKHVGYRLHWAKVVDASDFGVTVRIRWLALAFLPYTRCRHSEDNM